MKLNTSTNLRVSLKDKEISDVPFHIRLRNDPDLYHGFKCNIAMAFKDTYYNFKKESNKKYLSSEDIHIIANAAAEYFLQLWTSD